MRIQIGDTIVIQNGARKIAIIERRQNDLLFCRIPEEENRRDCILRKDARTLADILYDARKRGAKYKDGFSITGNSTLADLVGEFGYATQRLRQDTLSKVIRQLQRAGLEVFTETDGYGRDDKFKLMLSEIVEPDSEASEEETSFSPEPELYVSLPKLFWPSALGLDPNLEQVFLRSLTAHQPILCLLFLPDEVEAHSWLQATWEGLISWAFHSAQRFCWIGNTDYLSPRVTVGPANLLQTYLQFSVLSAAAPDLSDGPHSLNLISIKNDTEFPVDSSRLRAIWPGPVFDFKPHLAGSHDGQPSEDLKSLLDCLFAVAGSIAAERENLSPLKTLLWAKDACSQIMVRASGKMGDLFSTQDLQKFRGSNESAAALSLKVDLAHWLVNTNGETSIKFELSKTRELDHDGDLREMQRVDLYAEGRGRYEVETMVGSGPMEAFYHKKIFSRLKSDDSFFSLVVPNESIIWAGPFLSDIAYHLGDHGCVMVPGTQNSYLRLNGKPLEEQDLEIPWDELRQADIINESKAEDMSTPLKLSNIAGYENVLRNINEQIIWPERHRKAIRRPSRSSGILFFGPPGCGKSRLAQAIAGELDQEVRLLSPSDLRGAYIGWGQIMIREHFDWVAEHESRMLIIDELDAVASSRHHIDMHSDERASVNELLVQIDRISRLGRLLVATTNFVESLDDAVIRSGRFGRYIPVAPPNVAESLQILFYYLKALARGDSKGISVQIPPVEEVHSIYEQIYIQNKNEKRFFCGADLEEAVNRTYQRCLQLTIGNAWPEDYSNFVVSISADELGRSLNEVARSITDESIEQFIADIKRFCGGKAAHDFELGLGA